MHILIRWALSVPHNQDTHRDKTGTAPHDSGTPGPLHF
jgi:hypothetical protein